MGMIALPYRALVRHRWNDKSHVLGIMFKGCWRVILYLFLTIPISKSFVPHFLYSNFLFPFWYHCCFAFIFVLGLPTWPHFKPFPKMLQAVNTIFYLVHKDLGGVGGKGIEARVRDRRPKQRLWKKWGDWRREQNLPIRFQMSGRSEYMEPTFWYKSATGTVFCFISLIKAMLDPLKKQSRSLLNDTFINKSMTSTYTLQYLKCG